VRTETSNSALTASEEPKSSSEIWNSLDSHTRERALRILSELCYAYIAADADSALEDDNFEDEELSENKTTL